MRLVRTLLQPTQVIIFSCSLRLPGYTIHSDRLLLLNHGVPSVQLQVVGENECATRRLSLQTRLFKYTYGRGVQSASEDAISCVMRREENWTRRPPNANLVSGVETTEYQAEARALRLVSRFTNRSRSLYYWTACLYILALNCTNVLHYCLYATTTLLWHCMSVYTSYSTKVLYCCLCIC